MKIQKSSGHLAGAGVLAAVAASLCCLTPVLALLAGTSGLAATFSWLEPFRPYLMGLTITILGLAWYQKLKPRKGEEVDCECDEEGKLPFLQRKSFLGIVTIFALLTLAFPYYSDIFYPDRDQEVTVISEADVETATFDISGMSCGGCEEHVNHAVNELRGIVEVRADYMYAKASVKFDRTRTSIEDIKAAIDKTGYKVTGYQLAENR